MVLAGLHTSMSRTRTISSWPRSKVVVRTSSGSWRRPANTSAYVRATRAGVSRRPSRSGSSPMAIEQLAHRASARSRSIRRARSRGAGRAMAVRHECGPSVAWVPEVVADVGRLAADGWSGRVGRRSVASRWASRCCRPSSRGDTTGGRSDDRAPGRGRATPDGPGAWRPARRSGDLLLVERLLLEQLERRGRRGRRGSRRGSRTPRRARSR